MRRTWRILPLIGILVCASLVEPGASSRTPTPAPGAVLQAPSGQLVEEGSVVVGETRVRRLQQRVDGIDVLDGQAIVASDAGRSPRVITDSTRVGLAVPRAARISRTEAMDTARRYSSVREVRDPAPEAKLVIDASAAGGRLVWQVLIAAARPLADLETLVDAQTGLVVGSRHLEVSDTAPARVFDPNPVVQQQSYAGLSDKKDRDSPLLDSLLIPVTLERITSGSRCLEGAFVTVLSTRKARPVCSDTLDFSGVTRSQSDFEAVMSYFHIDRLQSYIQSLGFTNVNNRQTRVIVNPFRFDNSFYFVRDKTIRLGRGGVDDAEDADIIVHEYGHAIQDAQVPGFGRAIDARSMGEGFGDYLAAAASAEFGPGNRQAFDACIGDWDAISYRRKEPSCLRRADETWTLGEARRKCQRQIHCVGTVWSSALLRLRQLLGDDDLGRNVVDRVVLASHFLQSADVKFPQAGRAVECADEMLYPSGVPDDCQGEHFTAIHAELTASGIL
jgi:hypothetical protein